MNHIVITKGSNDPCDYTSSDKEVKNRLMKVLEQLQDLQRKYLDKMYIDIKTFISDSSIDFIGFWIKKAEISVNVYFSYRDSENELAGKLSKLHNEISTIIN